MIKVRIARVVDDVSFLRKDWDRAQKKYCAEFMFEKRWYYYKLC